MASTLHKMFLDSAAEHADTTAFTQRVRGSWTSMTYADARTRVERIGAGLMSLGVAAGGRVAILSMSCREWTMADYATLGTGATVVPVYQTNSPAECAYILNDSSATVVFVEDAGQLAKIRAERANLPHLTHVIVFNVEPGDTLDAGANEVSLADIEAAATDELIARWHDASDGVAATDLATIIYTSGTTGPPKGCMLTHHNYVYMTEQAVDRGVGLFAPDDRCLLFLPLAHTFARLAQFAITRLGIEMAYTTIATLMDDMAELKPTVMPSVPRVFEKAYTKILSQFNEATGAKKALVDRAMRIGALRGRYIQHGRRVPPLLAAQYALFERLVFSKIHQRFGGHVRIFISGGAPLSREVAEFFLACGVIITEGYGLTESTTAICVNHPRDFRHGSVGKVFDGTDVKIGEDGEILVKGDIVFQGYYGNEDATRETLDQDGWLHTGDIGDFDREGFLYITDRKKDLIVTAGGKNIAPANIENGLKATQYVSQAFVFGDRKPYITALLTLDADEVGAFAAAHDVPGDDMFAWIQDERVQQLVAVAVEKVNAHVGRVEQIKRYRILPIDFSQETGELTPSLKLKRKVVVERYGAWIEEMYERDAPDVAPVTDRHIVELQDAPTAV